MRKKPTTSPAFLPTGPEPRATFPFQDGTAHLPPPDPRHRAADNTVLEVSPEQLLDIAKHLPTATTDPQAAIAQAYRLICEAHLTSRNLSLWNADIHRQHRPADLHQLLSQAARDPAGHPLRIPLLTAFFKARGSRADATNAAKQFNEWLRQEVRHQDYTATLPWNPHTPSYDPALAHLLLENSWIVWGQIGQERHLRVPTRLAPLKKIRRPLKPGEHPTAPYWTTTDVWWPQADPTALDQAKDLYLTPSRTAFLSDHAARQGLAKFARWLDREAALAATPETPPKPPRNRRGTYLSPTDRGAGRTGKGAYGK